MAQYPTPASLAPVAFGAAGGALVGLVALAVMAGAAVLSDLSPTVAANAIGAWLVRWLQTADPDAIEAFYYDATLGGIALASLCGALAGAVFSALMTRFPDDHPAIWGVLLGLLSWALTQFVLAPVIDPLMVRVFAWRALLPTFLIFGLVVGAWVQLGRGLADQESALGA